MRLPSTRFRQLGRSALPLNRRSGATLVVGAAAAGLVALAYNDPHSALTALEDATTAAAGSAAAVLVGAGDVAGCNSQSGDHKTADLIAKIPGTVFTVGDNVYDNGTAKEYAECYQPTWGRFKSRTRAVLGNHEYNTGSAAPSFDYYGAAAGPRGKGYYSFEAASWHVVVLNSNWRYVATDSESAQLRWLEADLAAHPRKCVLALWHHPRFASAYSSPLESPTSSVKPFWDALYAAGADVIVNGHQHFYERFAPQTPAGMKDAARGIRQFVIGSGGRSTGKRPTARRRNSEVVHGGDREYGVLKLTLREGTYEWKFVPVAGKTFTDAGSARCH